MGADRRDPANLLEQASAPKSTKVTTSTAPESAESGPRWTNPPRRVEGLVGLNRPVEVRLLSGALSPAMGSSLGEAD